MPDAFVVAVLPFGNAAPATLPGDVNATEMPWIGLPSTSFTSTASGLVNAANTPALCPSPDDTVIVCATAARLLRLKFAGVATPATDAVTVYVPVVPFAVKTGAVAVPVLLVVATTVVT